MGEDEKHNREASDEEAGPPPFVETWNALPGNLERSLEPGEELRYEDDYFFLTSRRIVFGKSSVVLRNIRSISVHSTEPSKWLPAVSGILLYGFVVPLFLDTELDYWASLAVNLILFGTGFGLGYLASRIIRRQFSLFIVEHSGVKHRAVSRDPDHLSHIATYVKETIFSRR